MSAPARPLDQIVNDAFLAMHGSRIDTRYINYVDLVIDRYLPLDRYRVKWGLTLGQRAELDRDLENLLIKVRRGPMDQADTHPLDVKTLTFMLPPGALSAEAIDLLASFHPRLAKVGVVPVDLFPVDFIDVYAQEQACGPYLSHVGVYVPPHEPFTIELYNAFAIRGEHDALVRRLHEPYQFRGGSTIARVGLAYLVMGAIRLVHGQLDSGLSRRDAVAATLRLDYIYTIDGVGLHSNIHSRIYDYMDARDKGCMHKDSLWRVLSNVVFGMLEPAERESMVAYFIRHKAELGKHADVYLGLTDTPGVSELDLEIQENMVVRGTRAWVYLAPRNQNSPHLMSSVLSNMLNSSSSSVRNHTAVRDLIAQFANLVSPNERLPIPRIAAKTRVEREKAYTEQQAREAEQERTRDSKRTKHTK